MGDDETPPVFRERAPRTLEELESMSDSEVIAQIAHQGSHLGAMSFRFWMDELERRRQAADRAEQARLTKTMKKLTWVVVVMTGLVLAGTIAQVVILIMR